MVPKWGNWAVRFPAASASIGVARAFLHDAPFVLMDEPTSNLDSLNEGCDPEGRKKKNAGDKTVLLVSHRASTMAVANTVYSVESGEGELMAKQTVAEKRDGEKLLVSEMIALYCRKNHHTAKGSLCPQCQALHDYALQRIERCLYGSKTFCSACKVHCYKPEMRGADPHRYALGGPACCSSTPCWPSGI